MGKPADSDALNVLFIGNSFTQRNNVPGLIAGMATARGKTLEHKLISAGGASLRMHWNAGKAAEAIRTGGYDFVVLQEQSTLPVKNAKRFHENVRLFDEPIKAAGAKMALYLTWARKHSPEAQETLTTAYTEIGRELDAVVVPAGVAWQSFLSEHAEPPLHDRDQSHPTLAGSYLAACVFLGVLFKENPVDIDSDLRGLDKDAVTLLQKTAWQACKTAGKRAKS